MTDPPKNWLISILQSIGIIKRDILTYFDYDFENKDELFEDDTARSNFQGYHNIDKFLFQATFFDNIGPKVHNYLEENNRMDIKYITVYTIVKVFGTIGGTFTIIFALNRIINAIALKKVFKGEFIKDMRNYQLKTYNEEEAETKEQIDTQFRWLFSFEGMYKIFCLVDT